MSGRGISWAICKSALRSRQITSPAPHHSVFYKPYALLAAKPTASKHWRHWQQTIIKYFTDLVFYVWSNRWRKTDMMSTFKYNKLCLHLHQSQDFMRDRDFLWPRLLVICIVSELSLCILSDFMVDKKRKVTNGWIGFPQSTRTLRVLTNVLRC